MTANIDRAFEVEGGIVIDDGAALLSGADSPVGLNAPMGAIYLRTDNTMWEKHGQSNSNWRLKTLTSQKNFSFTKIVNNETILIPTRQQMIVHQELEILAGGELEIESGGELVI